MRRVLLCILSLFALFALLSACSTGEVISETGSASEYSLSCDRLTSTHETIVSVGESATATLAATISRHHGSLSVQIVNESGAEVYSGTDIASSTSFTLLLNGPADYTVRIECSSFTGSFDLQWETVGAAAADAVVPEAPTVSNEMVITNTTPAIEPPAEPEGEPVPDTELDDSTVPDSAEAPEWNGVFENAGNGVTIALFWGDNHTVEFQISGIGSVVTATARIDVEDDPAAAYYSYGEEMSLTFRLSGGSLTVEQDGSCSLIPDDIAGQYLPVAE